MRFPLSGFLWLWLCSEAAQLHGLKTKKTFSLHYESTTAAARNAQSRRWRTVIREGDAAAQASRLETPNLSLPVRIGTQKSSRVVRKSGVQSEAQHIQSLARDQSLRTNVPGAGEPRNADCSPEKVLKQALHGPSYKLDCKLSRSQKPRRTVRSEPLRDGALPATLAQEQEVGLNSSDYGEEEMYPSPDFPYPTPLTPVDTGTRRRPLKNPFYPLNAESCGAYAVMIIAAVIFSVGVIGNMSLMCIVCHNYYMRSISNSLLANLALWDFTVIFFCLPLVLFHQLTKNWLLGDFSCRIIPYLEVRE